MTISSKPICSSRHASGAAFVNAGRVLALIVACSSASIANAATMLTPDDASKHIGEHGTVCGVVASSRHPTRSRTRPTFLYLDKSYPKPVFTAVIFGDYRMRFGELDRLVGKRVCVSGRIRLYRGKPEIILYEPEQLEQQ